jgi:pyruvate dehydrogenase E2 component (dihydrolipoamide acetyltransferase)
MPGQTFACGQLVGQILADGESPSAAAARVTAVPAVATVFPTAATREVASLPPPSGRLLASPNARRVAAERGVMLHQVRGTGPGGRIVSEDVLSAPAGTPLAHVAAVATIAARNLADLLGVDLAQVPVDPVERRITREGVAVYVRSLLGGGAPNASVSDARRVSDTGDSTPLQQEPSETIRLSGMRGTIARRMHASLQEMAQLTLTMDADMTAVLADRAARKAAAGPVPSLTDYVVAATARALTLHPQMNAQVTASRIALLPEVHVGLAVAVDNGLLVPVIRDASHRDLADLSAETSRLATAARDGAVSPTDLEGGTFSVSALGAYGVDTFTPVINPPNAGILGVGRLREDVVIVDGGVTTVKRLTLSLTWDHRVLDGVPAAEFCRTIVELLADPARLD